MMQAVVHAMGRAMEFNDEVGEESDDAINFDSVHNEVNDLVSDLVNITVNGSFTDEPDEPDEGSDNVPDDAELDHPQELEEELRQEIEWNQALNEELRRSIALNQQLNQTMNRATSQLVKFSRAMVNNTVNNAATAINNRQRNDIIAGIEATELLVRLLHPSGRLLRALIPLFFLGFAAFCIILHGCHCLGF